MHLDIRGLHRYVIWRENSNFFIFFKDFLSRLHTNGPGWEPNRLPNVTFDNQEINKLLVDEEPANIFDLPAPSSSTSTSMYNCSTKFLFIKL